MTTRRTVLTVGAGAALVVGPATNAYAATAQRPAAGWGTSAVRRAVAGRLRVSESSAPMTHLGVTWRGGVAQVRLRSAAGWQRWRTLEHCPASRDGRAAQRGGSMVVAASGATGYEVWVSGGGSGQVTELNTAAAAAVPVIQGLPLPDGTTCDVPYLSRAAWGADESLRFKDGQEVWGPIAFSPVQALTVHHAASVNNDPDPAATVRAIYYFHCVTQTWGDIGYHLLIDEAGRVYEGRWSGDEGLPVFRGGSLRSGQAQAVTAAHAFEYNTGNVGVCLLGNLSERQPTAAARESLIRVLAALTRITGVRAESLVNYANPVNGKTRRVYGVCGHRDWMPTQCPGDLFYPGLPTLRQEVHQRMLLPPRPRRPWRR